MTGAMHRDEETEAVLCDEDKCVGCWMCIMVCPFGAIDWTDFRAPSGEGIQVARVNSTECKGCGLCVASCLSGAIQLKGFSDEEILAMVNATAEYHAAL